ncbi:MAG: TIGR04282 family arsenosugar biosynthesis glycosyltransferase [Gammaproteobacteria bacterium]|nr:TIGR04282 family arsenosugar biosynthesis glycosyltransferase [Gammaproteobacteria bacterium]
MKKSGFRNAVILFAKEPIIGQVKTRLNSILGERGSYDFYCRLLRYICKQLDSQKDFDFLVYTNRKINLRKSFFHGKPVYYQHGKDLGEKMFQCLNEQLNHYDKVVLMGADCPEINHEIINEALKQLDLVSHVFVPVDDGGYSLIATSRTSAEIFTEIDWGSDKVMQQTICKLKQQDFSYKLLKKQFDVDSKDDFIKLKNNKKYNFLTDGLFLLKGLAD